MRAMLIAIVAAGLVAGCSEILGLKEPDIVSPAPGLDAAIADAAPTDTAPDAAPIDGPACDQAACPFGCEPDTTTCRPARLWVFATTNAYVGDDFGGMGSMPVVRSVADFVCHLTAGTKHSTRGCTLDRTRAVLQVSDADSLALMATQYSIPTTAPVHRADDDQPVFDSWTDLIDPSKTPAAPVVNAASEDQGIVWSGAIPSSGGTRSNCKDWRSASATDAGRRGHATLTSLDWLAFDTAGCDQPARLLCVCWSGSD